MNSKRSFGTLLAALAAAALLPAAHAADIKLGVAEALSGGAAQYGASIRNGFQLAADQINAAGGVNGNKLVLVIEDEQGKKEEAINVFKKLIFQDKVLMVFGPTLSNSAQAADPIAQAAKTVVFGTSNTADGITSIGDYVFRNSVTEADVLPETLATVKRYKQFYEEHNPEGSFTPFTVIRHCLYLGDKQLFRRALRNSSREAFEAWLQGVSYV